MKINSININFTALELLAISELIGNTLHIMHNQKKDGPKAGFTNWSLDVEPETAGQLMDAWLKINKKICGPLDILVEREQLKNTLDPFWTGTVFNINLVKWRRR